jgi:hypothetical protein
VELYSAGGNAGLGHWGVPETEIRLAHLQWRHGIFMHYQEVENVRTKEITRRLYPGTERETST